MSRVSRLISATGSEDSTKPSTARVLRDIQDHLPLDKIIFKDDIILLLTPAVIPVEPEASGSSDPFEPLGLSIAKHHPLVRHVPYTKRNGITGVHVAFIKRAKVVIFIITDFQEVDGVSQSIYAEIVREACEARPLVIISCCEAREKDLEDFDFSTILQVAGFTRQDLASITPLLFASESMPASPAQLGMESLHNRLVWTTQPYIHERDVADSHVLWLSSLPEQFHLKQSTWSGLLQRRDCTEHRVVRHPQTGELAGFCLIYFATEGDGHLIKNIAAIVVRGEFRGLGIGRLLHDEALNKLDLPRRADRIVLGSTFPRLLYGVQTNNKAAAWFQERGWTLDGKGPGQGRAVSDWILRFSDMPVWISNIGPAGLTFRPCEMTDYQQVIAMVSKESQRKLGFGWYEQYCQILDSSHMESVLIGFEGSTLVATAITYIPNSDSPIAQELPWAASEGSDIGGVTCICIKDDAPEMAIRRDTVMVRLLHGCYKLLHEKGMAGMFIDGAKHGDAGFESLGFRKWAEYREAWRVM